MSRLEINAAGLLREGDKILVALSGGADSVALLRLLKSGGYNVLAYHLNHLLREQAGEDQKFCEDLCKTFGVPFFTESVKVEEYAKKNGISFEEAGRKFRYDGLLTISKRFGCNKIATGHHADDLSETFFLNLFRGSGIDGLSSIPDTRNADGIMIIRPLLSFTKKQIVEYLELINQPWREDHTNLCNDYLRNKIRNRLIPYIKSEYGISMAEKLISTTELLKIDKEYIDQKACEAFKKMAICEGDSCLLKLEDTTPNAIFARVIKLAVRKVAGDCRGITRVNIEQIISLKRTGSWTEFSVSDCSLRVTRKYSGLFFERSVPKTDEKYDLIVEKITDWDGQIPSVNMHQIYIDASKVEGEIRIRSRLPGDRMVPLGMTGSKKIKDLLIDRKIDVERRDDAIVVHDNEKIIWVAGVQMSELVKIDDNTVEILFVNFKKTN